jgi:pimeloyl-ACP methyl ester carboxylesterase/DNA-binding CsgD family transcriptional regulator
MRATMLSQPSEIHVRVKPANTKARQRAPTPVGRLLEALTAYAMDPTQWDAVAEEVARRADDLAAMNPADFLSHLSHAESLAWQLRGASDTAGTAQYAYALLAEDRTALAFSPNFAGLDKHVHEDGQRRLRCASDESQRELDDACARLVSGADHQALVTLRRAGEASRFGYVLRAERLPTPLRAAHPDARLALFVAHDTASDSLRRVLQNSFALTDAETAVTLKLAAGLPLKEAAGSLGISVNTARNQLQSVFDKTGVKRQSDLILVITQLSVILAATVADAPQSQASGLSDRDYPPYQFAITPDGRKLAYRVYGGSGQPVLCFHEAVGGSRLLPGTDAIARDLGLRVIVPDRPGCGFSDPHPRYGFAPVASDMLYLLDTLGVHRAVFVGVLSGAAHALATACAAPARCLHVLCISGRLPSATDSARHGPLVQLRSNLAKQPWMLNSFFNILRSRSSDALHRRLATRTYGASAADAAVLREQPQVMEHIVASTLESLAVNSAGIIDELRAFAAQPALPLEQLAAPVTLWHGRHDTISAPEAIAAYLGPRATHHRVFDDAGALLVFKHWREVLQEAATQGAAGHPILP